MASERLGELRGQVRAVTLEIFEDLAHRFELVKSIREVKRRHNLETEDPKIEDDLRAAVLHLSREKGLDRDFASRLLNLIVGESILTQQKRPPHSNRSSIGLRDILVKGRKLQQRGRKIVHLEIGEPDFGPPSVAKSAIMKALDAGRTHYADSAGIYPLRKALAEYLNRKFKVELEAENIVVTVGSKFALYAGVVNSLRTGGRAVVFEPAFPGYRDIISQLNGRVLSICSRLEDGWLPDLTELKKKLREPTDLLILNNPQNPTGRVLPPDVVEDIAAIAFRRGVPIISDEVYSDFSYKPFKSILECESDYLYTSSFSKSFGMTGFRIGYAVSSTERTKKIARLQANILTSPPEFIQYACIEVLKDEASVRRNVSLVKQRLQQLTKSLRKHGFHVYPPEGALYAFPKLDGEHLDAGMLAGRLLESKGIAIAPGRTFGPFPNYARLTVCQPEAALEKSVKSIREMVD